MRSLCLRLTALQLMRAQTCSHSADADGSVSDALVVDGTGSGFDDLEHRLRGSAILGE